MRKLYNFGSDGYIKCCIYKITNLINGKIYIGKTVREARKRWAAHLNPKADTSMIIVRALKKYGADKFSFEVIDIAENPEMLSSKETFYIKSLNSMSPNGYNQIDGVGNYSEAWKSKTSDKVSCFIKTPVTRNDGVHFSSISEAADESGTNSPNIVSQIKGARHNCNGFQFKYGTCVGWDIITDSKHFRVPVVRNDGVRFCSIKEAAIASGVPAPNVAKVLRGERKTCGGFSFTYAEKV